MEHPTNLPHLAPDGATVVGSLGGFLSGWWRVRCGAKDRTAVLADKRGTGLTGEVHLENFAPPTADGVGLDPPARGYGWIPCAPALVAKIEMNVSPQNSSVIAWRFIAFPKVKIHRRA
jgi:hypothetical protein